MIHLFKYSPPTVIVETPYSANVKRSLRAALTLDVRTKDLELIFKKGEATELDLLLEDGSKQLMIHEKWLDFQESHQLVSCQLSRSKSADPRSAHDAFCCDHVIEHLHDLVLVGLKEDNHKKPGDSIAENSSLRLRVSESLRMMPRIIEIEPGDQPGTIEVFWTDNESNMISKLHKSRIKCQITLHRESTCSNKRFELLGPESK